MVRAEPDDTIAQRREEATEWLLMLGDGALTSAEQDEFDTWLALPANADALVEMQALLQATDALGEEREVITMRKEALCDFEAQSQARRRTRTRRSLAGLALAASLVLAFLGGWSFLEGAAGHYETPVGEMRVVALEDGSQVTLDGDSEIDVDFSADHRAIMMRRGRARFNVAKDANRPFTVTAGNRTVLAVGTSFSVELLGRDVHVQLFEGKVSVLTAPREGEVPAIAPRPHPGAIKGQPGLEPGEELVALAQGTRAPVITPFKVAAGDAWQSGELVFEDMPLAQALERMNRYATQPLVLDDEELGALKVNGVFRAGDVRAFADGLSALYPLDVDRSERVWRISRK